MSGWLTSNIFCTGRFSLLAQSSTAASSEPESYQPTVEQVLDRPWPWSIWLSIVLAVALCLAVGALYYSERGRASWLRRTVLAALRVSALLLVWWMLAGWSIQRFNSDLPELVVLVDDSASMQTDDASPAVAGKSPVRSSRWETARQVVQQLWQDDQRDLAKRYRLKLYALSTDARQVASTADEFSAALDQLEPVGQQSRLGEGLIQVLSRQSGRPTAAIVLVSDGIVTSGSPLEEAAAQARRLSIPVVTIATGQQLPQPDLGLADLLADDAVVLGDRVTVQVSVIASDISASRATVTLRDMQSGQVVDTAEADLSAATSTSSVQLSYIPAAAGSSLIRLEVAAAPNEKNLENNTLERIIDVRDQTLRVLLIQKSPSFEFRFLKTLLERTAQLGENERHAFDVDAVLQDADSAHVAQDKHALRLVPGDRETIASYDVVVVGQIDPSLVASSTQQLIVDQVTTAGCGLMFICHPGFDPSDLAAWPLGRLMPIDATQPSPEAWTLDASPRRWQPTSLGQTALPLQLTNPASAAELWRTLPGPDWSYIPGGLKPGAQVLAVAVAPDAPTTGDQPLLISQFAGAGRVAMQTSDETYRWLGFRGSDLIYDRYWIQMLRWLARGKLNRQDQSELAVEPRQSRLGQPIQFSVRLSSEAAASLGSQPSRITLQRIGGESKTLTMQRTQSASAQFKATDSSLAAGSYRATISQPPDAAASSVTFTVTAPPGEQANLRSDWPALRSLAEQTHGQFLIAADADELLEQLPEGAPVRRGALPPVPLWNSSWIAAALVILLALEWILRRSSNML
ncbi:MAG: VWA domain-containing protein [Aureliella sp.]